MAPNVNSFRKQVKTFLCQKAYDLSDNFYFLSGKLKSGNIRCLLLSIVFEKLLSVNYLLLCKTRNMCLLNFKTTNSNSLWPRVRAKSVNLGDNTKKKNDHFGKINLIVFLFRSHCSVVTINRVRLDIDFVTCFLITHKTMSRTF